MSIPFESAVGTLQAMFPEWDEETLTTLLISNSYHVERTIEMVLSMQGDGSVDNSTSETVEPITIPKSRNMRVNENSDNMYTNHSKGSENGKHSRFRGLKCDLPDDFLRPPSYFQSKHIIADEELAMMLQNELFQKEVREMLGDEFFDQRTARYSGGGGASIPRGPGAPPVRRDSRGGQQQQDDIPDLGIMKALSSMGTAAKKNLTQLAERFAQGGSGTTTGTGGVTGTAREFRPLVDSGNSFDDEEEEGDEVISFDNNKTGRGSGSGHVLQEPVLSQGADNPLLQTYNRTYGGGPAKKDR